MQFCNRKKKVSAISNYSEVRGHFIILLYKKVKKPIQVWLHLFPYVFCKSNKAAVGGRKVSD